MFILAIFVALILIVIIVIVLNNSYKNAIKKTQENIIQTLNESAIIVNNQQKIIFFNNAADKLLNIPTKNVLGQSVDAILKFSNEQAVVPYSIYTDFKNNEQQLKHSFTLQLENSTKLNIALTVTKNILYSKNQILLTLLDTSGEQQLEEMKVDFVSMAAHELRTPLTAIRGYASILQMHYASNLDEQAKELLTRLIVSTTNLTNLIDNLLSVSRIERNDLTIETKPIDLSIIINDIYTSFKQEALTRKQNLTLNMPENLPTVMADPFRIGQVFINLIGNAITYSPNGGNIGIIIADRKDHLEISIQDNGEGIPKEAMPRIFTKFFRVSNSLEQGSKGSGMGLYISKSIVELHHGKIWAESTIGQGSIFTFTLPTATDEQKKLYEQNSTGAFLTVKNGQGIIIRNNQVFK